MSSAVPGSGTKWSRSTPKIGTLVFGEARFVNATIGVTSWTTPDGSAVEEVADTGPWAKPVDSPLAAVRAAIVAEHREKARKS